MTTPDRNQDATTPENRNLTAKTLIGNTVKNRQGEALGTVQDFMMPSVRKRDVVNDHVNANCQYLIRKSFTETEALPLIPRMTTW